MGECIYGRNSILIVCQCSPTEKERGSFNIDLTLFLSVLYFFGNIDFPSLANEANLHLREREFHMTRWPSWLWSHMVCQEDREDQRDQTRIRGNPIAECY